jgi:hypothetical protein
MTELMTAGKTKRARTLAVAVVAFAAGLIVGAGGLIYVGHYSPSPTKSPTPVILSNVTVTGNNSSLGVLFHGNFTVPGAPGTFSVVLIQVRVNVSASLLGSSVYVELPDGSEVTHVAPVTNSTGSAALVPSGALKFSASVGTTGTPFSKGVPFSATLTIFDEGVVATS